MSTNWQSEIDEWFSYHAPPSTAVTFSYVDIREAAKQFAQVIDENTPEGDDKCAAFRKIREAVMTANAGIACYHARIAGFPPALPGSE